MYMTYVADQPSLLKESRPTFLKVQSDSKFRPTWLVRTSDMERVPGTEATHGYCTLSYSWNYSGDIFPGENGKYEFFDHGKHRIILKKNIKKRKSEDDEKEEQEKEKGGPSSFLDHHEIKEVKFEQLIQQVCKDFDIDYIWYDKICIDQNDKAAKHAEIARMYKIYQNAFYTVAMIPEMSIPEEFKDTSVTWKDSWKAITSDEVVEKHDIMEKCLADIGQSQWLQRLWTLEEAIMSKYMVFVGRNAHLWNTYRVFSAANHASLGLDSELSETLYGLHKKRESYCANYILRHAHARSTTKEHDRAFALGNIFHDRMDVKVDYGMALDIVLSNFYSDLIEKDLSILFFGKARETYKNKIQGIHTHTLPSWTGIGGAHVSQVLTSQLKDQEMQDIIKIDRRKKVGTKRDDDDDNDNNEIQKDRLHLNNIRYIAAKPRHFPLVKEDLTVPFKHIISSKLDAKPLRVHDLGIEITHYITELTSNPVQHEKMDREMMETYIAPGRHHPITFLSLTEECDECMILDLPFTVFGKLGSRIYPVIRKVEQNGQEDDSPLYKSIGVFIFRCHSFYLHLRPMFSKFTNDVREGSFVIV
ncbi:heterokaryon incompatibility protein-domain-containing protein [Phascolomyces articulosus]|uniref:Heterokaryon incompatibility protein-domain-containing protein n=1 Tax=Phascolomyces articulosus TaxID=60185 RepID=A0AAD5P8K9_9FUNG|nr:heterokaryon incompatibility protein-domain-containing protein [Phascolomyces articulosus]